MDHATGQKQQGQTVVVYYNQFVTLWNKLYGSVDPTCGCRCEAAALIRAREEQEKTHHFLLGLDDKQFGHIRSQIIATEPVPDIHRASALIVQEERHKSIVHGRDDRTDALAFAMKRPAPTLGRGDPPITRAHIVEKMVIPWISAINCMDIRPGRAVGVATLHPAVVAEHRPAAVTPLAVGLAEGNPKFMATAVDLGRELIRRRISLAYGGGNVGLQGAVASTVFTNGGLVRGFIPGYIATRRVYGPTYGVEHTVSSNYYKYFEMNHAVEAFIILPGGVDTMEGLFTLISWASEGLHNRPIGLLNIDGYFNNLLKFLDDAVRQNFMALNQRKLFISSFFVDELLDKLELAKAFPGPGAGYDEFANPERLDLELHL
ncbi:unnamed protein product [Cuscuta campestris]|uniref:cytokinin riboside 5'-monophosphate phosphoribohydrolase n=1 Tax=Cuscuta campestris TaxID=132261 RepID=A0A484LKW7_9ASTE|nr:unnamed protein product [Cuscuta campestris]